MTVSLKKRNPSIKKNTSSKSSWYIHVTSMFAFIFFAYFLWKNRLAYAIVTWLIVRIISFLTSMFFASHISRGLTLKDEEQKYLLWAGKSLASLILYYGLWTHSYEIVFISINIFILIYLIVWMKKAYSNVWWTSNLPPFIFSPVLPALSIEESSDLFFFDLLRRIVFIFTGPTSFKLVLPIFSNSFFLLVCSASIFPPTKLNIFYLRNLVFLMTFISFKLTRSKIYVFLRWNKKNYIDDEMALDKIAYH